VRVARGHAKILARAAALVFMLLASDCATTEQVRGPAAVVEVCKKLVVVVEDSETGSDVAAYASRTLVSGSIG